MRKKQVESNPYIYTLSKLFRFLAMKYQFLIHNRMVFRTAAGAAVSYAKGTVSQKNKFQINSDVYSSRNHWKCKYIFHGLTIVFPRIPYLVPALAHSFCMLHVAM